MNHVLWIVALKSGDECSSTKTTTPHTTIKLILKTIKQSKHANEMNNTDPFRLKLAMCWSTGVLWISITTAVVAHKLCGCGANL